MNVILCGYDWTGCRALDMLINLGCNVFVCTHDAPPHIPSLHEYASEREILATTETVNDTVLPFKPDILCSIYYRYIIKKNILELVNYRAMNLHPSLLPKYRGCSSLTWAMIHGDYETGFTYHYINEGCDTGKVILQKKLDIYPFENQNNLYQRAMFSALKSFTEAFQLLLSGYEGQEQKGEPTYYARSVPENGEINLNWNKRKIKRFIRAMINPPLPYAKINNVEIKKYSELLDFINENRHCIKKF